MDLSTDPTPLALDAPPTPTPAPMAPDAPATAGLAGTEPNASGAQPPTTETKPSVVPLRSNRDYTLLQTGATLSAIGNGMSGLAFLLLGFALTHSSARAGLLSASFGLGELLLMLPAGALVDRWNRRTTMVATALVGALVFATIPVAGWLGRLTYPHLLVVAFVEGTLGCFYSPAERAVVKRLVAPEQLGAAMSVTMARSSLGSLVGPPLAGVLYGMSRTLPFLGDAVSWACAAGCAALTRQPQPAPRRSERTHVREDVREGMAWVWRTPAIRDIVALGLPINLGVTGIVTVAILALQRGGTSGTALGLMEACVGIAGIVGAVVASPLIKQVRVGTVTITGVLVIVALACLMPVRTSIWWVGALLTVMVVLLMPVNTGVNAYQMHITPDAMQGRSGAAASFVAMTMIPVANGSAGFLLEHLGRTPAMLCYASMFVVGAVITLRSRAIREIPTTDGFGDAA